jgi:hypothetical protein
MNGCITLAAILLPLLLFTLTIRHGKMQQRDQKPFPFLELPQELRDMVYEYFLDDPFGSIVDEARALDIIIIITSSSSSVPLPTRQQMDIPG